MRVLLSLLIVGAAIFAIYSLFGEKLNIGRVSLPVLTISGERVFVEVADSPEERYKGLSGRDSMPTNRGMLFVFDQPGRYSFVMREMYFGLDFLWIDENWRVVGMDQNIPENYTGTLTPPENIKYVLELNSGWTIKNNVEVSAKIDSSLLNKSK